jgi:hypothetical protein
MKNFALLGLLTVAGCSATQVNTALNSPTGQLFCAIQTDGGGTLLATVVDAAATAASPGLSPVAVIATGATKTFVDNACAQAAANVGGTSGVPVSPPAASVVTAPVAVTVAKVAS